MKTSTFIHEDFIESGEARLFLYDDNLNSYQYLGKVEDVMLNITKEVRTLSHNIRGQNYELDSRVIGQSATLSFTLLEDANPECAKLIWGDATTTQTIDNTYTAVVQYEARYLHGTAPQILMHQRGILQATSSSAGNMGVAVGAEGSANANSSSETTKLVTATDYLLWVAPGYGTQPAADGTELAATDFDGTTYRFDKDWTFGIPTSMGAAMTSGGGTGAFIDIDMTGFTGTKISELPDFWVVLVVTASGGTLALSQIACTFDATSLIQTLDVGTLGLIEYAAYNPVQFYAQAITAYGDDMVFNPLPTAARLSPTTEVTFNKDTGELARSSDASTFLDGWQADTTYWVWESPNVEDDIGNEGTANDERQLLIACLAEHDSEVDVENMREEGLVYVLERCNMSAVNGSQSFTKDDWHAGETASIPVIRKSDTGRFGTRTILKTILANHKLGYA